MKRHKGDKKWSSKSRWDPRELSQTRNNNFRGRHKRGSSSSLRTFETSSDRENQDKHRESRGEHLDGQRNDGWQPPAPPSYPAANFSVNGNQPYMPLPYLTQPNMFYQGLQHQVWSSYCQLANYHQTAGTSSGPNQRPSFFPFPPPHFHGVRQFNGPQEDGSENNETSKQTREEKEVEEPPPPGSEAAREKERAEIARRLQDFDKNPAAPSGEKEEKEKSLPKEKSKPAAASQSSAKKPAGAPGKARPKDDKAPNKTLKRPATSCSSEVPKKNKKANELDEDIAKRISAMGVNKIKNLVNNPHSVKSQEILKALMNHYRELKTVELDKRRLLAPTSVDNSASFDANSIGISDLPPEIISQLEKILGCDIFQSAEQAQADDEVCIVSPDPQQSNNNQVANGDQETGNCQPSEPVQILEELVFIDLRIQSDISRKMELYQRLHEIVVGSQQTRGDETAESTSFPPVIHLGSPLQSSSEIYDMKVADSSVVLVACSNKVIYGFDLKTAKRTHELKGHVDVVTCLKPVKYYRGSIEEHIICSGGFDEQLCIFGFKKFIPKGTLDCGEKAILALLATKEGSLNVLLVASEDKTICLRDASTGLYLRQFSYSYVATNFVAHEDAFFCQSVSNGVTYFNIKASLQLNQTSTLVDLHDYLLDGCILGFPEGKLLCFQNSQIVAAARMNDMFAMPFTSEMKAALNQ
ncbi:Hypothetical predicted protein [Cloeon dipterum]|uniref:Uncharacterized protein n=1 Tax=Cloeon dipterum TaxID=197152 RepID=A0A8S1BYG7_9INSE|nr:Hypothetical predicted protein [Cloeon dipterum]